MDFSKGLGDQLSPRIYLALTYAAESAWGAVLADAAGFTDGSRGGSFWGSEFFPEEIQGSVFKAFVRGIGEIVQVIEALLKSRRIPTVPTITQVLTPFTGKHLEELGLRINRHV